jgi:hypothetical protein
MSNQRESLSMIEIETNLTGVDETPTMRNRGGLLASRSTEVFNTDEKNNPPETLKMFATPKDQQISLGRRGKGGKG